MADAMRDLLQRCLNRIKELQACEADEREVDALAQDLEAALAQQPAQGEAVVWVSREELEKAAAKSKWDRDPTVSIDAYVQEWAGGLIPLYTAPPAPSVPDEQKLMPDSGERDAAFVRGWNACRAAMLASGGKASVADGWKLVPPEATEEMVSALRVGTIEPQGMVQQARIIERIKSDYQKFLAAAPEPPR